jgi:hypothetical protein
LCLGFACIIGIAGVGASAAPAMADFGATFEAGVSNADGTPYTQAGGHPFQASTEIVINSHPEGSGTAPDEDAKDLDVEVPPGFVGNPQAVPKCAISRLLNKANPCPIASQVGVAEVYLAGHAPESIGGGPTTLPIYNLIPEPGHPGEFGFIYSSGTVNLIYPTVRTGGDYGLTVTSVAPQVILTKVIITFWGVPSDPRHDAQRCLEDSPLHFECGLHAGIDKVPFLTNPVDCDAGSLTTTLSMDSWQNPGVFRTFDSPAPAVTGCSLLSFEPTLSFAPSSNDAETPTGLAVDIGIPQVEGASSTATPELKEATVTLPQGLAISPAASDGLQGCSNAQIALESAAAGACPQASQIGTVAITSPLLSEVMQGQVFLGTPTCAPCSDADAASGNLVRLFIQGQGQGVVIKAAGTVSADPSTGQLTAHFKETPELPFSDLHFQFKQGPRAPLATPSACGTYTTTSDLEPWSTPYTPDATPSSSFAVDSGPGGTPCPPSPAARTLSPALSAGTLTPIAGAHSPLTVNLTRDDGQQQISSLNATLPPGLLATLKGVPYCSDAGLAAAAAHGGRAELASPSCPAASQIGTVQVGAGPGSSPYYISGKVYLAGRYKGAPLSIAFITSAVAGPFDLGTVVVRSQIQIDASDAQIHVISDQLPQMLAGIPLDVRDIRVNIDRPNFTLNPTNCSPFKLFADVFGASGGVGQATNLFQVGACAALPFSPTVSLTLKGATKRTQNPALRAVVTEGVAGEANAAFASVALPKSEFLDNSHIGDVCTRVQFSAGTCPATSIYGRAKAWSPLLEAPLEGPVYLRSSDHTLPDLVAALKGPASQPLEVDLVGRVDSGASGGIRTTFESVPDAEVSRFVLEMKGGKKGLLENSTDLCANTHRAVARLTAQNGKTVDERPIVNATSCPKGKESRPHRGR